MFSPSRRRTENISFIIQIVRGAFDIWRINSDGTNPIQLTDFKDGADVQYDFAEDGKILIFTRQRNDGGNPSVMKVSIDGSQAVELFDPADKISEKIRESFARRKTNRLSNIFIF